MRKKGKYKLFSFEIDKSLIIFRSIKNDSKLVAFSLIKLMNLNSTLNVLNQCIVDNLINYYSIQLPFCNLNGNIIVIKYKTSVISETIKLNTNIERNLLDQFEEIKFLKGEELEEEFFKIIPGIKKTTLINYNKNALITHTGNVTYFIEILRINPLSRRKNNSFIVYQKLIQKYDINGYFLLNFKKKNRNEIFFTAYLFIRRNLNQLKYNIREDINEFFHYNALMPLENKFNVILCFWREALSDVNMKFNELKLITDFKNPLELSAITHYLNQFEKRLVKYEIEHNKINQNIFLLNRKFLFLIYDYLNFERFNKIINKFENKYEIFLFLVKNKDYLELMAKKYNKYDKIKLLNPEKFNDLDFNYFTLKKLKNAQINS